MTKKVYISGPITGIKDYHQNFKRAEEKLIKKGYKVFNPANIKGDESWTWQDYMKECVKALPSCDLIYLLDGWESSRGAKVEASLADDLGIGRLR